MNLAFIPVRCGSKAIEWKNIKSFCGKPLLYWCLQALEKSEQIHEVHVATDCDKIEHVVNDLHFSKVKIFRRDPENATSDSSTESVILEFLDKFHFDKDDCFVLTQATNPFVKASDFDNAIQLKSENDFDSMLTCCRIKRFFWNENGTPKNYDYQNRPLRQYFQGELVENGAFYINSVGNILNDKNRLSGRIGIYEMPEFSFTEIDELEDWIIAEQIFRKNMKIEPPITKIKLLLTDVDGVLTDSGMYYTESGDEIKKFSTYDGMAFKILKGKGIKTGMITSEDRQLNSNRAKKLKMDFVFQGINDKLQILQELCKEERISLDEVVFVGDDINDIEVLKRVGLAACPSNARDEIKAIDGIIQLETKGGDGVIRELVEKHLFS